MIKQVDSYPFSSGNNAQQRVVDFDGDEESNNEAPYYHNLKRVQETVSAVYPNFPMQSNKDFFVSYLRNWEFLKPLLRWLLDFTYCKFVLWLTTVRPLKLFVTLCRTMSTSRLSEGQRSRSSFSLQSCSKRTWTVLCSAYCLQTMSVVSMMAQRLSIRQRTKPWKTLPSKSSWMRTKTPTRTSRCSSQALQKP